MTAVELARVVRAYLAADAAYRGSLCLNRYRGEVRRRKRAQQLRERVAARDALDACLLDVADTAGRLRCRSSWP